MSATMQRQPRPTERQLRLPDSPTLLEEINLPPELASTFSGTTVTIQVFAEEKAMTRRIDIKDVVSDSPSLIDRDGAVWNDYRPVRVVFTDTKSSAWRIPRNWLDRGPEESGPGAPVPSEMVFAESISLPTEWDLSDINIPPITARRSVGYVQSVEVRIAPSGEQRVFWRDPDGHPWRIPHNWRRRRILLPNREVLVSQGVPEKVAAECAGTIVSVNYHPGSLCCLPDQYRFRDGFGRKWPVRIADCVVVGYGDGPEFHA